METKYIPNNLDELLGLHKLCKEIQYVGALFTLCFASISGSLHHNYLHAAQGPWVEHNDERSTYSTVAEKTAFVTAPRRLRNTPMVPNYCDMSVLPYQDPAESRVNISGMPQKSLHCWSSPPTQYPQLPLPVLVHLLPPCSLSRSADALAAPSCIPHENTTNPSPKCARHKETHPRSPKPI